MIHTLRGTAGTEKQITYAVLAQWKMNETVQSALEEILLREEYTVDQ